MAHGFSVKYFGHIFASLAFPKVILTCTLTLNVFPEDKENTGNVVGNQPLLYQIN